MAHREYVDSEGVRKRIGLVIDFVSVLRDLKKALKFDSEDVSGVIEDLDLLLADFLAKIAVAKSEFLDAGEGGTADERLEALVYGRRVAQDIAQELGDALEPPVILPVLPGGQQPDPDLPDPNLIAQLRQLMTEHVGVVRTAPGLRTALRRIAALEAQALGDANMLNMTATATLIAAAALLREESRGAHCRSDFPQANPALAQPSRLTLAEALALRQTQTETSE